MNKFHVSLQTFSEHFIQNIILLFLCVCVFFHNTFAVRFYLPSVIAWMSSNALLEVGAISKI